MTGVHVEQPLPVVNDRPAEAERRCKTCGVIKPMADFPADPRYSGGHTPTCRACRTVQRDQLHRRPRQHVGMTRPCSKCHNRRDLSEFTKDRRSPDGYSPRCSSCRREDRAAANADPQAARARFLRWKYGITVEQYDEMFAQQGGMCAVCGGAETIKGRRWLDVDHCHRTGRVRALLCSTCNRVFGMLAEDPNRIAQLLRYALSHETDAPLEPAEAEVLAARFAAFAVGARRAGTLREVTP